MTRDDILNMPAGREMDKFIWGWLLNLTLDDNAYIPAYSTDIAAAWEVVYKLNEKWSITIDFDNPKTVEELKWYVGMYNNVPPYLDIEVRADTAPLAICRAALLAVMEAE